MNKLKIKFDSESFQYEGIYPLEDTNDLEVYDVKFKVNALLNINDKGELVENPAFEVEEFEMVIYEEKTILVNRSTYFEPDEYETVEVRKIVISEAEGFEIIPNEEWAYNFNDLIDGCELITVDMDNLKVYL